MRYIFLLWAFMLGYALVRDIAYFKILKHFKYLIRCIKHLGIKNGLRYFRFYLRAQAGEPILDDMINATKKLALQSQDEKHKEAYCKMLDDLQAFKQP